MISNNMIKQIFNFLEIFKIIIIPITYISNYNIKLLLSSQALL
jgi:hypothetical protein